MHAKTHAYIDFHEVNERVSIMEVSDELIECCDACVEGDGLGWLRHPVWRSESCKGRAHTVGDWYMHMCICTCMQCMHASICPSIHSIPKPLSTGKLKIATPDSFANALFTNLARPQVAPSREVWHCSSISTFRRAKSSTSGDGSKAMTAAFSWACRARRVKLPVLTPMSKNVQFRWTCARAAQRC